MSERGTVSYLHARAQRLGGPRGLEPRWWRKGKEQGEGHAEGQEKARLLVRGEGEKTEA